MPEWKEIFTAEQIKVLIAYLRFLGSAKYELMGDPKLGVNLYHQYYQVCHGIEGDGDGIMTQLLGIMPMVHTNQNETNKLRNQELAKSILDGKEKFMPAWRNILSQSEVEALISYIRLLSH